MKNFIIAAALIGTALSVTACENFTLEGATERVIATKEIAVATINTICTRPEDDVVRVDIRKALAKISSVDSRKICTEGLDVYLSEVVSGRDQGVLTVITTE